MTKRGQIIVFLTVAVMVALSGCGRSESGPTGRERSGRLYRQAMADCAAGRMTQAIESFTRLVQLEPGNASARFQLACLQQECQKDYLGAIGNYREYLLQQPGSDKAPLARERLEMCERLLAPILARRMNLLDNAAISEENGRLRKANAELTEELKAANERLSRAQARSEEYARESENLRRLLGSGETESTVRPVVSVSERDLLDDDEEDARTDYQEDLKALRAEEKEELSGAPFSASAARKPSPAASSEPPHESRPATYVVQEGDTLTRIALRFYGVKSAWKRIRDANRATISTDGRVRAGMSIRLP